MAKERKLTDQQRAFVQRYTVHWNATRAAKEAGYSEKSASQLAYDLLDNPLVRDAIKEAADRFSKANEQLKYRVVEQLTRIAFSSIKDYGTFDDDGLSLTPSEDLDDGLASVIQEFHVTETEKSKNVKFKLASKEKALELLGRHLGLFNDKLEVNTPKPFIIERRDGTAVEMGTKAEEFEE